MADIVQANLTNLLIRKIGYSAGLEHTFSRLSTLTDHYVLEEQLSERVWKDTVEEYGRVSARQHFENFFQLLNVMSVRNGRPVPGLILDVLALLFRFFPNETQRNTSYKAVILYALITSDGELFLNLLRTKFKSTDYVQALAGFRARKLEYLYEFYKMSDLRHRLHRIVDFELQDKLQKELRGPFANQRTALDRDIEKFGVEVSDDWFTKVPGRRQNWAIDLDLYSSGEVTDVGQRLLSEFTRMTKQVDGKSDQAIFILPTDLELSANHVSCEGPKESFPRFVDILKSIGTAYTEPTDKKIWDELTLKESLEWVRENFKKADSRFQMLRKDVPFTVFALFQLGCSVALKREVGDLEQHVLDAAKNDRSLLLRTSRNSLYGLTISRKD
jgi:hypothetical protein